MDTQHDQNKLVYVGAPGQLPPTVEQPRKTARRIASSQALGQAYGKRALLRGVQLPMHLGGQASADPEPKVKDAYRKTKRGAVYHEGDPVRVMGYLKGGGVFYYQATVVSRQEARQRGHTVNKWSAYVPVVDTKGRFVMVLHTCCCHGTVAPTP